MWRFLFHSCHALSSKHDDSHGPLVAAGPKENPLCFFDRSVSSGRSARHDLHHRREYRNGLYSKQKYRLIEEENMDRFVRNFIVASIVYLGVSSALGVCMLWNPSLISLKFVHSHLNLLGWVSMMIYGVGYHVLPRFSGRPLKYPKMGEVQFWTANAGLLGMLFFYTVGTYSPAPTYALLTVLFGAVELLSIVLFFYNMLATLLPKAAA
jgi:hypothetical protein